MFNKLIGERATEDQPVHLLRGIKGILKQWSQYFFDGYLQKKRNGEKESFVLD